MIHMYVFVFLIIVNLLMMYRTSVTLNKVWFKRRPRRLPSSPPVPDEAVYAWLRQMELQHKKSVEEPANWKDEGF